MPDWACKSHITTSPIYYHNYLIGKMFGAQLRSVMATAAKYDGPLLQLSVLREKDSVSFLKKKVLRVGRELHWWELVQLATGESLKATYFADELKQTP